MKYLKFLVLPNFKKRRHLLATGVNIQLNLTKPFNLNELAPSRIWSKAGQQHCVKQPQQFA
jgi:hypothetical protein